MSDQCVIFVYWSDEDGVWVAEAPDAHGETPEAAVAELRVDMEGWPTVAREQGLPIPAARFHAAADAAE